MRRVSRSRRVSSRTKLSEISKGGIYSFVPFGDFHDAFMAVCPNDFSYEALEALFDDIESTSYREGAPVELDVIGITSEWYEYATVQDAYDDYSGMFDGSPDLVDANGNILDEGDVEDAFSIFVAVISVPGGGILVHQ